MVLHQFAWGIFFEYVLQLSYTGQGGDQTLEVPSALDPYEDNFRDQSLLSIYHQYLENKYLNRTFMLINFRHIGRNSTGSQRMVKFMIIDLKILLI